MSHLEYLLEIQKSANKHGLQYAIRWFTARWFPVENDWKVKARAMIARS